MPAIYEHKAWLIGRTPAQVCRDADLFTRAVLAEYEQIGPDALTVGLDVYNVEAEAAGCRVTYYGGADASVPGIAPQDHAITPRDNLKTRAIPHPLRDGRMPINIEVARRVVREVGDMVWVRGAISGPFSLAVSLAGAELIFTGTISDPLLVSNVLDYAGRIILEFAKAYLDVGAGVVIFDSQASCDLLSPSAYRVFVRPVMQELMAKLHSRGLLDVPLIIGGNTAPIVDDLLATGANNLLCDFKADWPTWLDKGRSAGRALRRNLDPRLVQSAAPEEIYAAARRMIAEADGFGGFIAGTAVVPFGTPTVNLLAVKQACRDAG